MRWIIFALCLFAVALGQANTGPVTPPRPVYISIIIDDIGYNLERDRRFIQLDPAVTLAILPHTPHGVQLANLAYEHHNEVMLHMPMSSVHGVWPGPGTLTTDMDEGRFLQQVRDNLRSIPHVVGVNNHMGSLLTPDAQHMQWLMQELRSEGIGYYIDSMTSTLSRARYTAQESGLPTMRRDVFLDNIQDAEQVRLQFARLLHIARRQGFAIAIGHPHDVTLQVLEEELARLDASVKLVPISALLKTQGQVETKTWQASSSP